MIFLLICTDKMNGDTYAMSKDFERNFTIEKAEEDNKHFLFKCKYTYIYID